MFLNLCSFETGHGIVVDESGNQKQIGELSGTVSSGRFSFTNPDGTVITVSWIADERGFQATGDHLPTPPPMPEHVVKMLADMEAALDAISIVPETPSESAPVVEDSLAVSAPVEAAPVESAPVESAPAVEDSSAASAPVESAPVEAAV